MITAEQIRAAKAMLKWSGEKLGQKAGISLSSIRRVESGAGVPEGQNVKTLMALKVALEDAGVEFVGSPDDRPGVRLGVTKK